MAQFSQALLGSLTQSPLKQGMFDLGQTIGAAPGMAAQREAKTQAMQIVNQALASNDPQQLLQASKQMANIDPELSMKLAQAAQQATAGVKKAQMSSLEQGGADITAQAQKTRAIQVAKQRGDTQALPALSSGSITGADYLKSIATTAKTKATVKEVEEIVDGKPTTVFYSFGSDGELISKTQGGQAVDEESSGKPFIQTAEGSKAYREVVASANVSSSEVGKYSNLLSDAEQIFSEQQGGFLNTVGGYLGAAREFVVNDVAGLGDEITIFRTKLNEVQMQNAIKLLPRGPASDRDVALALSSSVDPKNLKGEQLLSYLRGMKKIAEAEQEYMQGKVAWVEQTGDPNALGYERYAAVQGAQKKIAGAKADYGQFMSVVEDLGSKAQQAAAAGDTAKAEDYKMIIREVQENNKANGLLPTDFDVFSLFETLSLEQARYEQFAEKNNINYF